MSNVIHHPAQNLMAEVAEEQAIADTPEAHALQEAICKAVGDYYDYLDRHNLLYDVERELMRASALHVIHDCCSCEIILKDGPIDRRYNGGEDPDPECRDLNPTWPPSALI
jgi:hypothetical protein